MRVKALGLLSAAILLGGGLLVFQVGAAAAKPMGACVMQGTANFSSPVTTSSKSESYTFSGTLSKCHNTGSSVSGGTISASGSGTVSCASSTTAGTATVTWSDGTTSAISFTATGAGSAVYVQGPITSGKFAGQNAKSALSFTTTSPQACVGAGLSSLGFTGAAAIK